MGDPTKSSGEDLAEPRGASLYADYIAEQITREDQRKTSIEARGIAVITTSGALATLLLGFATLSKKATGKKLVLPEASHLWVKLALVLFAAAAVGALIANIPGFYKRASEEDLRNLLETSWKDSVEEAQKEIAENRLDLLDSGRAWNDFKGWTLFAAGICEVVAVGFIAYAVWLAL